MPLTKALTEYVAELPNETAASLATNVIDVLLSNNIKPKVISAIGDGGICLSWPIKSLYAAVVCRNDGYVYLNYRPLGGSSTFIAQPNKSDLKMLSEFINSHL